MQIRMTSLMIPLALGLATAPLAAQAQNSASSNAPGQDRVCLVTTGNPGSFNDADVTETKWLPRKAAEAQASKDPNTMKVFDYSSDPLVTGGQYASAEELCKKHFNK